VPTRPIIFLDDGGVMNDNRTRALQWQRLVGEYFVPLLGGSPEAWSRANRLVTDRLFEPDAWRRRVHAAADYRSFDRDYQVKWLRGMCGLVGIETPPAEECLRLARRAAAFITRRVQAAFPGVGDTVRALHRQGYRLHTASGESSLDLEGYLQAMRVRDCFGRLYGPDLIDTLAEWEGACVCFLAIASEDSPRVWGADRQWPLPCWILSRYKRRSRLGRRRSSHQPGRLSAAQW
jgi:hypothetical protein